MTREEAIEKLEQTVGAYLLSGNADNTYCKEWREILEALEQEPCEDAVSRQAVLDLFEEHCGEAKNYAQVWEEVEELPSVQPKPIECEDAISRQAMINLIRGCNSALEEPRIFNCHNAGVKFEQYVTELPSVRPSRHKGHWLYSGENGRDKWTCDNCFDFVRKPQKTCPNCGAKMVEPQESEDKE